MMPAREDIMKCVTFKTSRSGGKGGQNVNKVSSKVELIFNLPSANFFNEDEKKLIAGKLANRMDGELNIHIVSQEDRSQLMNKERTVLKLLSILAAALTVQKKRKPTKIPKSVIKKRLSNKHALSVRKELRKRPVQE